MPNAEIGNSKDPTRVIERFAKRMNALLDDLDPEEAMMWRKDLGHLAESASLIVDQSHIDFSNNGRFVQTLLTDNGYVHNWMNLRLKTRFPNPDTIEDVSQLADALGC